LKLKELATYRDSVSKTLADQTKEDAKQKAKLGQITSGKASDVPLVTLEHVREPRVSRS